MIKLSIDPVPIKINLKIDLLKGNKSQKANHGQILSKSFFCRPSDFVAPDLLGCVLIKKQKDGNLLHGVIVETEAYSQSEAACHGFRKQTKRNSTLFGEPGNLYVYLTYGVYHCVNIVTERNEWASGVLLRALAIPGEHERVASGPGLLARRFDLNISHDNLPLSQENGIWIKKNSECLKNMSDVIRTTRVGISEGKDIDWRWYLKLSRSVSKRAKGDKTPPYSESWVPKQGIIE